MKALVLNQSGCLPSLDDFEEPVPRPLQSIIDVEAAGLNPIDIATAAGALGSPPVPGVVGREGVGRCADGRRVYFDSAIAPFGSVAERCLVADEELISVPERVDPAASLAAGIAGMAAWLGLEWRGRLERGETVLVLGSSSIVGQVAIQIARHLGAGRVVAAARNLDELRSLDGHDVDAVVHLDGSPEESLRARMQEACEGVPIWFSTCFGDLPLRQLWGPPDATGDWSRSETPRARN